LTNPTNTSGSGSTVTSTTFSATGGAFTAKNSSWDVEVAVGKSSDNFGSALKAGETAVSVTVVSPSLATTTT